MGPAWPGGRRSVLRQWAGNSRSFFSFFFWPPPSKCTHFTLVFVRFFPWGTFHDGKVTGAFSIFLLHLLSPELFPPLYSFLSPSPSLHSALLLNCIQDDLKPVLLKKNSVMPQIYSLYHRQVRNLVKSFSKKNKNPPLLNWSLLTCQYWVFHAFYLWVVHVIQ